MKTTTMPSYEYARMQLVELQEEQKNWWRQEKKYKEWKDLPLWKRVFTKKVEKPHFSRCMDVVLHRTSHILIAFRMYFCNSKRELSYVINEDGYGYKFLIDSSSKESLIGSKGMQVSAHAETLLASYMRILNPLIVE